MFRFSHFLREVLFESETFQLLESLFLDYISVSTQILFSSLVHLLLPSIMYIVVYKRIILNT